MSRLDELVSKIKNKEEQERVSRLIKWVNRIRTNLLDGLEHEFEITDIETINSGYKFDIIAKEATETIEIESFYIEGSFRFTVISHVTNFQGSATFYTPNQTENGVLEILMAAKLISPKTKLKAA